MVRIEQLGRLVPGPASAQCATDRANNNVDIAIHGGRCYLAWRTAPTHFASANTRIHVASCSDVRTRGWRHETTVAVGADLREPRLVVDGDRLHLFVLELGTDPKRFQPRRTRRSELTALGWSEPVIALDEPVVPWRIRRLDDRWAMSCYRGAEKMYGPRPTAPVVEIRWSDDLEGWSTPVDVHVGGTEMELVRLDGGRLVGVTRMEGPGRYGSDVLLGERITNLRAVPNARKLDSPNLVVWRGRAWLFARRSLGFRGRYDLAPHWLPGAIGIRVNQAAWSLTRKRSALWTIDPDSGEVVWMADLPSAGDCSFAAVAPTGDGSLLVADYTSPTSDAAGSPIDPIWLRGQLRPTVINAFVVSA